jgi:hypothetical protein
MTACAQRAAWQLAEQQRRASNEAALARFAAKYETVARSPYLAKAGEMALEMEIIKDIRATGVVPDHLIAEIRGNMGALAQAQQELRRKGHRIRSAELLDATGQVLSREFGIQPNNTREDSRGGFRGDRAERKRAAQQQPRAASMRMAAEQAPRPKTARDIVAETRRARGFPSSK